MNYPKPESGSNFLNPTHNAGSTSAVGQISSRQLYLGLIEYDTEGNEDVTIIGGLGDGNINLGKTIIPVTELGGDEFLLVDGRPAPFTMNLSKMHVNGQNLLASMLRSDEKLSIDSTKSQGILMNLSKAYFKKPRDFRIMVYNDKATDTDSETLRCSSKLKDAHIVNYNFSVSASQEVIFENVVLMGNLVEDQEMVTVATTTS